MRRLAIGRAFTRVAASVAIILAALMSFGAALLVTAGARSRVGGSVTAPSVTLSTTAAGATNVTYTTSFTTSSTGSLAPDSGTITLAAAAGTIFSSNTRLHDRRRHDGDAVRGHNAVTSNGGATVTLTVDGGCGTVASGDTVLVTAAAVSNPATTSTGDVVTVSTSSDTTAVQTNTYAITAAQAVASPSVTLSTTAAGATNVTYDVRFTTSSTGALASTYSTITLALPAGTVIRLEQLLHDRRRHDRDPVRVLQRGHEQRRGHGHPDRRLRHHRRRRHGARHGDRGLEPDDDLDR